MVLIMRFQEETFIGKNGKIYTLRSPVETDAAQMMDYLKTTAAETDADFCLIAKGDSMMGARIFDGDEVFIQQTDLVQNGEIAAVVVDGEATLKRVYYYPEEGKLILTAENPAYAPLVFSGTDLNSIHILGRAVAFQSKLR